MESQLDIGIHLIPRGFLSTRWIEVLQEFQVKYARSKLTKLLRFIWIDFTDKLWRARNDLVHHQENAYRLETARNYNSRLLWYLENPHVLLHSDRFILCFTASDQDNMSDRVQKHTLHHLDIARKTLEIQLQQRQKGQSVLTQFFRRAP